MKKKRISKIALGISLIMIGVWLLIGATSSIAWFKEDDTLVNSLNFGTMDIDFYYKDGGQWVKVDQSTEIFDDEDLYEPGFTHVTYFKIVNNGTIPFKYDLAIAPIAGETVLGTSVLGNDIDLADYIKFGMVTGSSEAEVIEQVEKRNSAREYAVNPVSSYTKNCGTIAEGGTGYAALILYMPEDVGNAANYRGDKIPKIGLSISAIANQIDN